MVKKILIISTSLRKDSNSERLADEFMSGAKAAGHSVEKIEIRDKKIGFCRGCLACQHTVMARFCKINFLSRKVFDIPKYMKKMNVMMGSF